MFLNKKSKSVVAVVLAIIIISAPLSAYAVTVTGDVHFYIDYSEKLSATGIKESFDTLKGADVLQLMKISNSGARSRFSSYATQKSDFLQSETDIECNNNQIKNKAKEIILSAVTDYEKVKAIHKWITENIYYDYDYANGKTASTYESATDVLNNKYCVCVGYSNLFAAFCRALGIPCVKVAGLGFPEKMNKSGIDAFKNASVNHAWNEVYADGKWIIVDTTWDTGYYYQNGSFNKGPTNEVYLNIEPDEFAKDHWIYAYYTVFKSGDFWLSADFEGIAVEEYVGNKKEVTLPKETSTVASSAFENNKTVEKIILPEGVLQIGDFAFFECKNLKEINAPESLMKIGTGILFETAYYNNPKNWTNKILYFGKHIVDSDYENIISADIKDGTKSIADCAFINCNNLTSVYVPDSVEYIGLGAFYECEKLNTVLIDGDVKFFHTDYNYNYKKPFGGCPKSLVIYSKSTTYVEKYALENNIKFFATDKVTFMPGDVTGDKSVNLQDVTRLAQKNAKWKVYVYNGATDVNGDNAVNLQDVTHLARYISRWQGITLSQVEYLEK